MRIMKYNSALVHKEVRFDLLVTVATVTGPTGATAILGWFFFFWCFFRHYDSQAHGLMVFLQQFGFFYFAMLVGV